MLDFSITLPDDLPPGLYVPTFAGFTETDGVRTAWDSGAPLRLPLVVNVGKASNALLPFALFYDDPSDGSRGILPDEAQGVLALSNRVRFNSPVYVLQPFDPTTHDPIPYPLEPYLPDVMNNRYGTSACR